MKAPRKKPGPIAEPEYAWAVKVWCDRSLSHLWSSMNQRHGTLCLSPHRDRRMALANRSLARLEALAWGLYGFEVAIVRIKRVRKS